MHGTLLLVNSEMRVTGGALSVSPGIASLLTMTYRPMAGRDDVTPIGGYGPSGLATTTYRVSLKLYSWCSRMRTSVPSFVPSCSFVCNTHTCIRIQDIRAHAGPAGAERVRRGSKS